MLRLMVAASATQQRTHPCEQLGKGKRFDQIIVGTEFEPLDAILDVIAGSEKQHRHFAPGAAQTGKNLPSVKFRQHHVENREVVFSGFAQMQAVQAVAGKIHDKTGFGQPLFEVVAGFRLVLHDQYFHDLVTPVQLFNGRNYAPAEHEVEEDYTNVIRASASRWAAACKMRFTHQRTCVFDMKTKLHKWNRKALVCALALTLAPNLPALAGETGKPPASLAGVVEQAWHLHPQAAGLDALDTEARATREVAGGLIPEPASVSLGNLNDRQGRNLGKQEWEVELAVPLWMPGQKDARGVEADSRIAEAIARRIAVRLDVAGEVREAWWSLAAARSAKSLAARRLDTARALDTDVQKRFKVGELSRIDANLAQAEALAAEAEMIESQATLLQAEQAFRLLTGIAAPADLGEESVAAVRDPLDASTSSELHPQLAAVAAAARSARARVKVAEETRRAAPELALRVVRERGDFAEPFGNSVGVKLTIPFSSGAQVRRDNSAAQAEAEQADAEMRRAEIRVQQDVERARRTVAATQRQLVMAQERRTLSADNLHLSEKSFALGEADLATLLRVRAAALEAESVYDRQRLARAAAISRLNQSLGVLP